MCIDDYAAGRQAVDHLILLGHRRIAMIATVDPEESGWPGYPPLGGLHVALSDAGIAADEDLIVTVEWGGGMEPRRWSGC